MKTLKIFTLLTIVWVLVSCKKENKSPIDTHPYKGTVRLFETKRNLSLKYYNNTVYSGLYLSLGTEELLELLPGKNPNQYYIRPKDYPEYCLDYSTKNEYFIKLFPYMGNDAQLFSIVSIGEDLVKIQSVIDTSLYLMNNSDFIISSPSSFLKTLSERPTSLNYWRIEVL